MYSIKKIVFPGCVSGSPAHLRIAELLHCPQLSGSDWRRYTVARNDEGIVLSLSTSAPLTSNKEGEDDSLHSTYPVDAK